MPTKEWAPKPGAIAWLEEPANTILGLTYAEDRRAKCNKSLSQEEYLMNHLGIPEPRLPCRRQPLHRSFGRSSSAPTLRTSEPAMHSMTLMAEAFDKTMPGSPSACSPSTWGSLPASPTNFAHRIPPPATAPAKMDKSSKLDFSDIIDQFGDVDRLNNGAWRTAAAPSTVSSYATCSRPRSYAAMGTKKKKHPHAVRVTDAPAQLFSQGLCFQAYSASEGRWGGGHSP